MASLLTTIPTQNGALETLQERLERLEERSRKPRKESKYTREERAVIGKFKKEYRRLTTREGRADLFQTKILPAIFNYWDIHEIDVNGEVGDNRIKVCKRYVIPAPR
jgi:hypothetical protein